MAKKYSKEEILKITGETIEAPYGYITVLSEKAYKSSKQNKLFHSLLSCFHKSGCASYGYKDLRMQYKALAGLMEYRYENELDDHTRAVLWESVKNIKLGRHQFNKVCELLKGKILIEHSWSDISKEMATVVINQLIQDMFEARVDDSPMSSKFSEILNEINSENI